MSSDLFAAWCQHKQRYLQYKLQFLFIKQYILYCIVPTSRSFCWHIKTACPNIQHRHLLAVRSTLSVTKHLVVCLMYSLWQLAWSCLIFSVQYIFSQCRTAVLHCCKDDAVSQREMAILGVSELRNHWTDRLKIWHVITSVSWTRMPNFIKFGGTRTCRQYGEMYTSRTFLKIFSLKEISWEALPKKSTQQFQALNGLKCSTVGNLGS